ANLLQFYVYPNLETKFSANACFVRPKVVSFPYVPFPNEPLYRSDAQNRSLSPLILFLGLLPWNLTQIALRASQRPRNRFSYMRQSFYPLPPLNGLNRPLNRFYGYLAM